MYKLYLGCLALVMVGCDSRPATIMQKQAAFASSYLQCLRQTSLRLDDHRSDASVIAAAAAQQCSSEPDFALAASSAPQITTATVIVLDERNKSPN